MFPRSRRLSRADFLRPDLLHGKRASSEHFSIVVPQSGRGYAVVIAKKTVRLSVKRHLLKRRVLGALRRLQLPPILVVYPRASAAALSPEALRTELARLISQVTHTKVE